MNHQAIILLGGKGTRIQGLYSDRPKALVPVQGRPILEWQVRWLLDNGISRIHLAAGHMGDQIQTWAKSSAPSDATITCSIEKEPLGTAGGVKDIESLIDSDLFFIVNGDGLDPNLSFPALADHHKAQDSSTSLSMAVTRIDESGRFGTVEFDEDHKITAFREKQERSGGWINAGVYLCEQRLFEIIPANENVSLETEIFPKLATEGKMAAFPFPGPHLDMGTEDGLAKMESYLST